MSRVTLVAKGIQKQSKVDFLVWLDRNLGDFEQRELSPETILITTENVNCAKSLCKKKDIHVGVSTVNFSRISSIQSLNMTGDSIQANDEEMVTSLATSSFDFREDVSSENENDAGRIPSTMVDLKENFEIPSAKLLLLKKHNFLESLENQNLGGTCRIIGNHIKLSGSQEIISHYKIQIYDWLMKTSEVHIDVQKMPDLALSSRMLESINKSLDLLHVLKCNDHLPESTNECLALIFYNSTKKEAFNVFSETVDKCLCKWSIKVQQKVMEYLEKEQNAKIEDIFKKYRDLEHCKENIGSDITKWTFTYCGNKDYFGKATKEFDELINSVKVKTFTLERSLSSPTLQTYISGVMNEDHVHIHSHNVLGMVNQGNYEERAMIRGMVVSIANGIAANQDVDATFNSSFHLERINISIKHNIHNKYVCFATGFLSKRALNTEFNSLCEEILSNSTVNDEELPRNIKVKKLLNYVMDKAEEENIKSMAVTPSGFGNVKLFFKMCEMFSRKFGNIKLVSSDSKEVEEFQIELRALISSQSSPWTRAESLEFQVIGPDEEKVKAAEKKLTNFFA